MIDLKDVINVWMSTNKNLSRSWQLYQDPDDTWVLTPKNPKFYKTKARIIILSDTLKLHYDEDGSYPPERGCVTKMLMAYDAEFFQKLAQWMRFVRRR